ncbi:C2H2 type zinc finger domain [Pyrenophora seminiperda CCB06]|uniref:C2H2 type zinc finger domain n=1 Tax=Pyrenophora seminiperda CCB06 TaxID=1302712 RepID=A0A3M7MA65_9PLEO|nr:C2H2 type zinc finger domain [Pyrenophora seminiperda CCB06]
MTCQLPTPSVDGNTVTYIVYSCTDCNERFTSFAKWRVYESSEHRELGGWICWICIKSSSPLHESKEALEAHLRSKHPSDVISIQEEKDYVGINWQGSFWCGFCDKIKVLKVSRNAAHDDRFAHIRNHYEKGKTISEWTRLRPQEEVVIAVVRLLGDSEIIIRTAGAKEQERHVSDSDRLEAIGICFVPLLK